MVWWLHHQSEHNRLEELLIEYGNIEQIEELHKLLIRKVELIEDAYDNQ